MAHKPSNKVLESLEQREQQIKNEVYKAQLFSEGIKSRFWKEVESILLRRLKTIDEEKTEAEDSLVLGNDRKLLYLKGAREVIMSILNIKDHALSLNRFQEELLSVQKKVKDYSARLKK